MTYKQEPGEPSRERENDGLEGRLEQMRHAAIALRNSENLLYAGKPPISSALEANGWLSEGGSFQRSLQAPDEIGRFIGERRKSEVTDAARNNSDKNIYELEIEFDGRILKDLQELGPKLRERITESKDYWSISAEIDIVLQIAGTVWCHVKPCKFYDRSTDRWGEGRKEDYFEFMELGNQYREEINDIARGIYKVAVDLVEVIDEFFKKYKKPNDCWPNLELKLAYKLENLRDLQGQF